MVAKPAMVFAIEESSAESAWMAAICREYSTMINWLGTGSGEASWLVGPGSSRGTRRAAAAPPDAEISVGKMSRRRPNNDEELIPV
jgi:hypothetical protein